VISGMIVVPKEVTLTGWRQLEQRLPRDAAVLRRILDRYERETRGLPAHSRFHFLP
jgi:hypothetical protein